MVLLITEKKNCIFAIAMQLIQLIIRLANRYFNIKKV
jgi:hypothetical protein